MMRGTLEVVLANAHGLENTDFLCNMDAYAVLTCQHWEKKSKIASGGGSNPEWNETFLFTISEGASELKIKLMDKDTFTADDFIGEVIIPLEPVFHEESVPTATYDVVKDQKYCGAIRVGLKFTQQRTRDREFSEEEFGGWRSSSMD